MLAVERRFELLDELGAGGVGVVYRARDRQTGRLVALKTLQNAQEGFWSELKGEFRLLAELYHPNLVEQYGLHQLGQQIYLSMELLDGQTLDAWLAGLRPAARVERIIAALPQLVSGLLAIHGAGALHCDLKPRNIMVTPAGRVVLLDFGFSVLGSSPRQSPGGGTVAYMAPEQAIGMPRPASDWFGLARVLSVLLGAAPPQGAGIALRPLDPRQHNADVPAWLGALLVDMQAVSPAARPTGAQIAQRIRAHHAHPIQPPRARVFVGRAPELAWLREAWAQPSGAVVAIDGPSGVGKSELMRQFSSQLRGARVLSGRSNPNEQLVFSTLDPILDRLASEPAVQSVLSDAERAALGALFPAHVRAGPLPPGASPTRTLRLAAGGLRALLGDRPTLLWLDDLQWADEDSLELLRMVLEPGPIAGCLVAFTHRAARGPVEALLAPLETSCTLGPLTDSEARSLLEALVEPDVRRDLSSSGGLPYLIRELAAAEHAPVDVRDMLAARIRLLGPDERALLGLVALAAGPLEETLVLAATDASQQPLLLRLQRRRLLCRTDSARLRVYHDRIGDAVREVLPAAEQQALHRAMAAVLAPHSADEPERLVHHLLGAGEVAAVPQHALAAAARAEEGLAFARAISFYRLALEHGPAEPATLARLAGALSNAGRLSEAADTFSRAAAHADPDASLALRRDAALHLMRCGRFDDGITLIREVLASVGVHEYRSPFRSFVDSTARRMFWWVRGFPEPKAAPTPAQLARMETLWETSISWSLVDFTRSQALNTFHLSAAMRHGDDWNVACALGYQAMLQASLASPAIREGAFAVLGRVDALTEKTGDPYHRAYALSCRCGCLWATGQWAASVEAGHRSVSLTEQLPGKHWQTASTNVFRLTSAAWLGDMNALEALVEPLLADAADRHDLFALNNLRLGNLQLYQLAADRPERIWEQAEQAEQTWPQTPHHNHRLYHAISSTQVMLYEDRPFEALAHIQAAWPMLKAAQFLQLEALACELHFLQGRALLAAARAGESEPARVPSRALAPAQLRRQIPRMAKRIRRSTLPWAAALVAALEERWADAAGGFDAAGMGLHHSAARRLAGDPVVLPVAVPAAMSRALLGAG